MNTRQLFRESGRSVTMVANVAGLILMLFGLFFTVLQPPRPVPQSVLDQGTYVSWLLFETTGGWILILGVVLFVTGVIGSWMKRGLTPEEIPQKSDQSEWLP